MTFYTLGSTKGCPGGSARSARGLVLVSTVVGYGMFGLGTLCAAYNARGALPWCTSVRCFICTTCVSLQIYEPST